ncbi:MAG: RHS repeat-associated core domain-containing protein [Christensenellales bacterium]
MLDKTATYFYVRDTLENVLGIVDSTGNLVVQYAYNAWGKNLGITGTLATTIGACNPIRYKGYHFDSDTGMYYCHTRYYVPDWCRWLCGDSIAYIRPDILQQMNLFAYCSNEPVKSLDPSGCIVVTASAIIAALAALFVTAAVVTTVVAVESNTHFIGNTVKGVAEKTSSIIDNVHKLITAYAAKLVANRFYNSNEKHHIVAKKDPRAALSRLILKASGIGINDSINLVDVNRGYHRVLHTDVYYAILNTSMAFAYIVNGSAGVEEMLWFYKSILGGLK